MKVLLMLLVLAGAIYAGYYYRTKKEASMKKSLGVGCLTYFILSFMVGGIIYSTMSDGEKLQINKEQTVASTNTTAVSVKDEKRDVYVNRDSIINAMSKELTLKKDEFDEYNRTWVYPKTKPKYRNQNAFYCYFQINSDKSVSNFRFVMQYESDDWLFINKCIFNIDGENIPFIPSKMEHDNNSRIWEWFDEYISGKDAVLICSIADAKKVKVKLEGNQYSDTRTLKANEIASIKAILKYYKELGGKF